MVEHRHAQLVGRRERQLHLRLDAGDLRDAEACGLTSRVSQQRRLSDARLAPDDQGGAPTPARLRQQSIEHIALACPAQEPRSAGGGHRASNAIRPAMPRVRGSALRIRACTGRPVDAPGPSTGATVNRSRQAVDVGGQLQARLTESGLPSPMLVALEPTGARLPRVGRPVPPDPSSSSCHQSRSAARTDSS
jgi:hypothetical protein